MLNEETKRKLRLLNLGPVIEIVDQQDSDVQTVGLSFDQRFQQVVDYLFQDKYDEKVKRLIRSAHFRFKADMHSIYYAPQRRINREVMNELATCNYISANKNVILQGYTSSGKTYLACALGKEACRQHYRTRYIRIPDLFEEVHDKAAEVNGRNKLLKKYASYDVLILDEWLLFTPKEEECKNIAELIHKRRKHSSTIFCSQYDESEWYEQLGGSDNPIADSILDRIIHNAYKIDIRPIDPDKDISMREVYGLKHR